MRVTRTLRAFAKRAAAIEQDLIGGLAGSADFGHPVAQGAMMIDFCESEVFEREVAEAVEARRRVSTAPSTRFFEERAQMVYDP